MTAAIQVDQAPVSEKKTRRRLLSVDALAGGGLNRAGQSLTAMRQKASL